MPYQLGNSQAPMSQHPGHIGPGKGVSQEGQHHTDHGNAHHPAGSLDDQQQAHEPHHQIQPGSQPCPQHQGLVLNDDVGRRRCPQNGQQKVKRMQFVP